MKRYRVSKQYANELSGIFVAENEDAAEAMFDASPENELSEEYIGLTGNTTTIEEIE